MDGSRLQKSGIGSELNKKERRKGEEPGEGQGRNNRGQTRLAQADLYWLIRGQALPKACFYSGREHYVKPKLADGAVSLHPSAKSPGQGVASDESRMHHPCHASP